MGVKEMQAHTVSTLRAMDSGEGGEGGGKGTAAPGALSEAPAIRENLERDARAGPLERGDRPT
jgi:hypothetical protein